MERLLAEDPTDYAEMEILPLPNFNIPLGIEYDEDSFENLSFIVQSERVVAKQHANARAAGACVASAPETTLQRSTRCVVWCGGSALDARRSQLSAKPEESAKLAETRPTTLRALMLVVLAWLSKVARIPGPPPPASLRPALQAVGTPGLEPGTEMVS